MKHLLFIILFTITVHAAKAVDIKQFYAGQRDFTTNILVWTAKNEDDVLEYILERDYVEIYRAFPDERFPDWVIAPYYYFDTPPINYWNLYTLKVVFKDKNKQNEVVAAAYVFSIWWKY